MSWQIAVVCCVGMVVLGWVIESIGIGQTKAYTKGFQDAFDNICYGRIPKDRG